MACDCVTYLVLKVKESSNASEDQQVVQGCKQWIEVELAYS
jgi:hypothetical protein